MMSDDSENDGLYMDRPHFENNIYYKKYKLLLEECESIQKNSERLVYRIEEVKKITKRRLDHVTYLKHKLKSMYSEDWTEIPQTAYENTPIPTKAVILKQKKAEQPKEEKNTKGKKASANAKEDDKMPGKPKRPAKRKPTKEKDPRAPKRPSNPFIQFCQEQRQPLMEQLAAELKPGEVEPNKQELTRQLAIKWKTLNTTEKQIYVDMYERSKEKYVVELTEYNLKK